MNDEELRAFLDSATVGGAGGDHEPEAEDATPHEAPAAVEPRTPEQPARAVPPVQSSRPAPPAARPAAQAEPGPPAREPSESGISVPSFDELMNFRPPAPTEPAGADDEQLVPLILPGFSPEPKPRQPLPPVFRAETFTPQPAPEPAQQRPAPPVEFGHSASSRLVTPDSGSAQRREPLPHIDPAPTQPYDVLDEHPSTRPAAPIAAVNPVQAAPLPKAAAAPATPIAAAPTAPTVPTVPLAARQPFAPAEPEDPFAALSPDLIARDVEDDLDDRHDEYERISVTGGEGRGRKALPWIIVGAGVVIAIIASIFIVKGVQGSGEPTPTTPTAPTTTEQPAETSDPEPTTDPEPSETPEPTDAPSEAPTVDPGPVFAIPITQWGLTVDKSQKLGSVSYSEQGDSVIFEIPLAQSLPDSCAAAREGWGLRKVSEGKLEVVRPEPRCADADAAAVYDTIWGLMDHMAKSARTS